MSSKERLQDSGGPKNTDGVAGGQRDRGGEAPISLCTVGRKELDHGVGRRRAGTVDRQRLGYDVAVTRGRGGRFGGGRVRHGGGRGGGAREGTRGKSR